MCLACNFTFEGPGDACPKCKGTQIVVYGHDDKIGRVINERFRVLELVGKGGMGSVYLAEDLSRKGTYVAIKMLHAQLSEDKVSVKRFQQEASAASDLKHDNLIQQYDYGMMDEKQPFLVMEYLQGDSLSEIIKEGGPINPVRCARIFAQVMDGLAYAHNKGVVHRDIKPSNILLINQENGEELVKVLDFGLAKLMPWSGKESQHLTKTGEVFGSPIYMSPEQCMGKKLEPSSDIYSLGITLYEALTGKPPFKGQNVVQTASKHLSDPPPPFETVCPDLNLPLNLQNVVFKALEKEPTHRFLDMLHFKENLVYAVTGQGQASARVQVAMSSDATQPVKKVDLDNLKMNAQSVSNLRQTAELEKPKKQPPMALIAGAVAFVGIVAGLVFFMPKGGTGTTPRVSLPRDCKGTVYYLALIKAASAKKSNRIHEVHLQTPAGLVRLNSKMVPKSPLDLQIGSTWQAHYKGDDKIGDMEEYSKVGEDPSVVDANNLVLNFFGTLVDKDYQSVFEMLSDDYVKKTFHASGEQAEKKFEAAYKNEVVHDYRNGPERLAVDSNIPPLDLPTGEKLPPTQSTKILAVKPDEIQILVDTVLFYDKNPHGYELYVVKKDKGEGGTWKIDDIKPATAAQWKSQ